MIQGSAALRAPAIENNVARSWSEKPGGNVRRLRALPRVQTSIHAMLVCGPRFVPIEIRNLSQGGAGLRLGPSLKLGDGVIVHFPDGRAIAGTMVWSRLGFGGIEFSKKLDCDDELLGSISRRKSAKETAALQRLMIGERPGRSQTQRFMAGQLGKLVTALSRFSTTFVRPFKSRTLRRRIQRERAMIEVACRKQGFSWLSP